MQIYILIEDNEIIQVDVDPSDTIKSVKYQIGKLTNLATTTSTLYLTFGNKTIRDYDKTVSDYGIQKDSLIQLYMRRSGC